MEKLIIIGNVGRDAECRETNGEKYITFNVASTRDYTDRNGQKVTSTLWISCAADAAFINVLPYLTKGTRVYCEGYPSVSTFSSITERRILPSLNLRVTSIQLLGEGCPGIPRELFDKDGVMFNVHTIHQVTGFKDGVLQDRYGRQYMVDKDGVITPKEQETLRGSDANN